MTAADGTRHPHHPTAPTGPRRDGGQRFTAALVAHLPEPARRWLRHAIPVGTPLWGSVELEMRGRIRLGSWRSFTASEVINPPNSFTWGARTRLFGLPVRGYDRYQHGSGETRWRLAGALPVMSGSGVDITRSAAGRLATEAVLVPTAFTQASWHPADEPDRVTGRWRIGALVLDVQLDVGEDGQLREVSMLRWGNPGRTPFGVYPFRVEIDEERRFDGISIPTRFRAGWWSVHQTDGGSGEFFRAQVTSAVFG